MKRQMIPLMILVAALAGCGEKTQTVEGAAGLEKSAEPNLFSFCSKQLGCGYLDITAKQFTIPPQFEDANDFAANGLAQIKQNGKYGYIDVKGQMVIPPQFEDANNFAANGLARIKQNSMYGYIDAKGQMVIPPQFKWADSSSYRLLLYVEQDSKAGYIDAKGKWVVYRDTVCDTPVVKNADEQVVWPKKPVADICAEASYARKQAEDSRQREIEDYCSGLYVGKTVKKDQKFMFGTDKLVLEVTGIDKASGRVSAKVVSDYSGVHLGKREETSCQTFKDETY